LIGPKSSAGDACERIAIPLNPRCFDGRQIGVGNSGVAVAKKISRDERYCSGKSIAASHDANERFIMALGGPDAA